MITPPMPRAGSIQKNVLLMPPQLRLPGERLPGTWSAVMKAKSPFVASVGDEGEVGAARQRALERGDRNRADVVLAHQRHRLGFEHARAIEFAAFQQHAHEAPVVAGGRGKAAAADRRCDGEAELRLLQFNGAVHTVAAPLLLRNEARPLYFGHVVGGVIHPERGKDVLPEIILELLSGHRLDQLAGDVGRGAVVPALARIEQQRPAERIGCAGARLEVPPYLAGERIGQSGGVGQEVSDGRRSRCRTELIVASLRIKRCEDLQPNELRNIFPRDRRDRCGPARPVASMPPN